MMFERVQFDLRRKGENRALRKTTPVYTFSGVARDPEGGLVLFGLTKIGLCLTTNICFLPVLFWVSTGVYKVVE